MNSGSSESDIVSPDSGKGIGTRKHRRRVKKSNYLQGKCRKVYKLNKGLNKSLQDSPVSISGVCTSCSPSLQQISDGFKELKHRGSELKKRKSSLPTTKQPDREHYRNVSLQNEWIRGNLCDAMGNYLFCHTRIVKALHISPQHLSRQRKVKRNQFQKPVVRMTKDEVDKEKLNSFVQMPKCIETSECVVGWSS